MNDQNQSIKFDSISTVLWTEKYRPRTLDEVVGHDEIIKRLKSFVEIGNCMEFLFSGPPATGKTTAAIAFARDLFGENYRRNFEELNASDERGIDVVRTKIKDFAGTSPIPPATFKIIFLDEVDELTTAAQGALRRTIEKYHETCRFVLSCNYDNKLIAPIKSRFMSFHFAGLRDEDMKKLVYRICSAEDLIIDPQAIDLLVELSDKDTRIILNTLQVCALLGQSIDMQTVQNTFQVPDKNQVREMMRLAIEGDIPQSFEIATNHIINSGFDLKRVLKMMVAVTPSFELNPGIMSKFFDSLSEGEDRITRGNSPDIQLKGLLAKLSLVSRMEPACLMQGK